MSGPSTAQVLSSGALPVSQDAASALAPGRLRLAEGAVVFGASAGIFLTLGMLTLLRGHPEEDAYIMFRYAEHVAQGRGIVFNPAGPPAEGATDFLWMLMLSALSAVGIDVAVASVLLNALGAGLAALVLAKAIDGSRLTRGLRLLWLALIAASVPFLAAAMAAYGCFSSMLYAGVVLSALHLSLRGSAPAVKWLPALVLALALFRPDGVVLGGSIAVLGLLRARDLGLLKPYLLGLGAAATCGAGYFAWRYSYFGLPLPLPLYVKSRIGDIDKLANLPEAVQALARRMPGLGANLKWLLIGGVLGSLSVVLLCSWLLLRVERSWPKLARRALGALPALALFGSLTFAYQTQNFHMRFQAPIQLAVLYFALCGVAAVSGRLLVSALVGTAMVAGSMLVAVPQGVTNIAYQLDPARGGYLNVFSARYGRLLTPDTRVALTEAGRFPFWSSAECLDTIGLNSAAPALAPVSQKMLADFDPDILFFHVADTLDFSAQAKGPSVVRLQSFRPVLRDRYKAAFDQDFTDYKAFPFNSVRLPSLVMERYLEEHLDQFEVYAIDQDHDGTYANIFGIRKNRNPAQALTEIEQAMSIDGKISYLALRKERQP